MLGGDGSILWMFPGLARQHAKIKEGTHGKKPSGHRRQDTFFPDEYHLPQPCLDSVLKGGGWGGGGKSAAAEHKWHFS